MSVSQLTPRPRSLEDCCMDRLALLRSVPFFAASSEASLRRAAGRSSWQHFGKGGFLFHAGEQVDRIFVIASGQVAATITSKRGTPLVFHVATTGECPGHTDLLHDGPHTASAQALDAVTALAVPARTCTELLEAEPAALLAYAKNLAAIVRVLNGSLADLVFLDLERRLAQMLAESPSREGRVELRMTQTELAARLGVARQSLNQALSRLAGRGLIVVEAARAIRITDRATLEAFVASDPRDYPPTVMASSSRRRNSEATTGG